MAITYVRYRDLRNSEKDLPEHAKNIEVLIKSTIFIKYCEIGKMIAMWLA